VPLVSWEGLEANLLGCGVFRAPHHGGGITDGAPTWNEQTLYDTASPEAVVISVGTNNGHGHPTEQHLTGIGAPKRRLLCTQLTPRCHTDVAGVRGPLLREASRVAYAPYRHTYQGGTRIARPATEVPCAGSILVEIPEQGPIRIDPPSNGWHDRILDNLRLSSPRCR
jgi:hypothetical protein